MDDRSPPTFDDIDTALPLNHDWSCDARDQVVDSSGRGHFTIILLISILIHAGALAFVAIWGQTDRKIPQPAQVSRVQITLVPPRPQEIVSEVPPPVNAEPVLPDEVSSTPAPTEPVASELPEPEPVEIPDSLPLEPALDVPRLVAPSMPDIRRSARHTANRSGNQIDCHTRQRRSDLIDCGDEQSDYDFTNAEQRPAALLFALPQFDEPLPPTDDRTDTNNRVRANINTVENTMSATQTKRAVMGQ